MLNVIIFCAFCKSSKDITTIVKVDASQFFKAAELSRGLTRIQELLERVRNTTKNNAIAVCRFSRDSSFLCRSIRKSDYRFSVVSFERIVQALNVVWQDRYFSVGQSVLRRREGWPMGGSLSEPGTLVDMSETVRLLNVQPEYAKSLGWSYKNFRFSQLLAGVQHVDDVFLMSNCICVDCIFRFLEKTFPADIGLTLEEQGPLVRFLQGFVFSKNGRLFVFLITLI